MASGQPILKSILKRSKDRSMPAICANDLPHVRRTEQLLRTLEEARYLRETLESVLQDLMNFEWQSPGSGAVCVASALKMLSDIQKLYMKCFYEQRVLMERLRTKLESICSAGGILSFLAEEVHRKKSELSEELENNSNLQVCSLEKQGEDREETPEVRLAPVMSDEVLTDQNDNSRMMQELALFIRNGFKTAPDGIQGQLKSMNILVASMKEDYERDQKLYLATKVTMSAQQKNLRSALENTRADVELLREKQLQRAQDIVQDYRVKNNELLSAKALLESLEAEVRDLNRDIEDSVFSRAVADKWDSKYVLEQIESLSKLLQDAKISDHQLRHLYIEINRISDSVALVSTPDASRRSEHESIQTELTGAMFAEAIKSHAVKLFKRVKSKKRSDVNATGSEGCVTPRKSESE